MQSLKQKPINGSILVFTLIVMTILLMSALSIASVTVIERKTSSDTGKSNRSFAVADSGAEIILKDIKDNPSQTINGVWTCDSATDTISINNVVGGTVKSHFLLR